MLVDTLEPIGKFLVQFGLAKSVELPKAEEPKPVPSVPPVRKIIALDSGHSINEPGARSMLGAKEEVLNIQQANLIKSQLEKSGFEVRLVSGKTNDLEDRGEQAKGCNAFVSLHHNSFDGITDPGTEVFCTVESKIDCRDIAKKVCDNICAAIKSTNRGVKLANFTVIKTASKTGCPVVMLVESYFVNPYNQAEAEKRSAIAAMAIAKTLEQCI